MFRRNTFLRTTVALLAAWACSAVSSNLRAEDRPAAGSTDFERDVLPVLEYYCYGCHALGAKKGGMAIDKLAEKTDHVAELQEWLAVWKNLRSQMMPPSDEDQPTEEERSTVVRWIERRVFRLDPANPDPGRVTIRRLNRQEYRYSILDLLGVEFDVNEAFPADDTGYGFDTIGDVLSLSPLLMEKYLEAAETIVAKVIPEGPSVPTRNLPTERFVSEAPGDIEPKRGLFRSAIVLPFSKPAKFKHEVSIEHPGPYAVRVEMRVGGSEEATSNTADFVLHVNGKPVERRDLGWDFSKNITISSEVKLDKGSTTIAIELVPKDPAKENEQPLSVGIRKVELQGPLDGSFKEYPPAYRRVFVDGPPAQDASGRAAYAKKIIRRFADRAFRRPIDDATLEQLVAIANLPQPGAADPASAQAFERGVAQALTAILASPRFLFRAEIQPEPNNPGQIVPLDEFSIASRLSYFLWSSVPDDQLMQLAAEGKLRANLDKQISRMIADPKSERFVDNFVGQWLQTRDVETINVDPRRILRIRNLDEAYRIFSRSVRQAMREETEMLFAHLLRENGSTLDLLTADYTFLNEPLAKFYGIDGVTGNQMRKVSLDANSHRGGLLTHGSFLVVTSNPTRTSPVKRGLFVLENLLGTPAPPPPPDVPELEEAAKGKGQDLTMREIMEVHREKPLCASCHARMDPLGLALEEFNAIGMWRNEENGKPIETSGKLITGESFGGARELAQVIARERRRDFYRCLTEKMLTYAMGRGVEYYDSPTVDKIVADLEADNGKMQTLVRQIIASAPFQKRRGDGTK